ncbi:MAG: hypothetical protein JO111_02735 [Caulobacteraceae bacterium]|nr:hypothetical protein [Caulobacteraceae bacterium]
MNNLALVGAALMIAAPAAALAASPFDGTWKTDPKTVTTSGKPTEVLLKDGVFSCANCAPPFKVKADGAPHPMPADTPYVNQIAVTVVDSHTVRAVGSQGSQQMGVQTWTASPDGKTLTLKFDTNPIHPGAPSGETTSVFRRLAAGPAGSHAISGSWHRTGIASMSDSNATVTLKVDGPTVIYTSAGGTNYHAVAGGKPVPVRGDPTGLMASVEKMGDRKLVETDWRKGKKVEVDTYTVAPDDKTMTVVEHFLDTGRVTTEKAHKI